MAYVSGKRRRSYTCALNTFWSQCYTQQLGADQRNMKELNYHRIYPIEMLTCLRSRFSMLWHLYLQMVERVSGFHSMVQHTRLSVSWPCTKEFGEGALLCLIFVVDLLMLITWGLSKLRTGSSPMELEFPVLVTSTEPEFSIQSALQEKWRDWNLPLSNWSQCYTSGSHQCQSWKSSCPQWPDGGHLWESSVIDKYHAVAVEEFC